ncbi:hypothetical protein [Tepidiforma bonchosmolovskayae]|uniref:Uncharacterized protein n=1 Tax=Tepidiforma bonchosmolovskayae TaxID=2601677 RepID=A0ABX6BYV2_9CHLR|nr:hypothetical protein [Tepidiforma bonchosmolovskayae]QFG02159.1 hypothetical protein Tbon_02220 [Tepidiforma bonchosmolovskayae]
MTDPTRIYVDEEGRPVAEGDPRAARVLVGADAEEVLRRAGTGGAETERRGSRQARRGDS